jgi:protease secretion system membrane fusion protein
MNQLNNHATGNEQVVDLDLGKYIRLGWLILLGGLGGFLIWASLAPLDKGVPLQGTVTVASNKKAIQHETGGSVEAILVKDGQQVEAGEVLIKMNAIRADSEAQSSRVQYIAARTLQARLIAESNGKSEIDFSGIVNEAGDNIIMSESIALQKQIHASRNNALTSELAAIDQNIASLNAQIQGLETSLISKHAQITSLSQQLANISGLAKEGYVPTNRVLELEQSLASLNAQMAADNGNINRSKGEVEKLKLQKMQRKQESLNEVNTQLADAQHQADALASKLLSLDRTVDNIDIKAPVSGTVVGLSVFTKGAVVQPGFTLMNIVPKEDSLVVEGRLPVHLIDKVYPDLPVDLMFTAFNKNKTPIIQGIVTQISADRFTDEHTGEPFYTLVSKVAPEEMDQIKDLKIRPGMPVDMFVKTGERTMLNYLLRPILDHLKLSLSEE